MGQLTKSELRKEQVRARERARLFQARNSVLAIGGRGEELRPIGDAEFLRLRRSGVNDYLSFQAINVTAWS
jgi:hypothetical protein